ncbi:hypothetical protein ZWY2020_058358 [Hordeum vulgare]|nr:hypothetical protein ZWY2020_058358 [Hordeum vulgare]
MSMMAKPGHLLPACSLLEASRSASATPEPSYPPPRGSISPLGLSIPFPLSDLSLPEAPVVVDPSSPGPPRPCRKPHKIRQGSDVGELNEHDLDKFLCTIKGEPKKHFVALLEQLGEVTDLIESHEETISELQGHRHDYADEIAKLSSALEEERTLCLALEESYNDDCAKMQKKLDHDVVLTRMLKSEKYALEVGRDRLKEEFDILDKAHKALKGVHFSLKESHDQLQAKLTKEISTCPPFVLIDNTCATNPCCEHVHLVEENAKLKEKLEKGLVACRQGDKSLNDLLSTQKGVVGKEGLGLTSKSKAQKKTRSTGTRSKLPPSSSSPTHSGSEISRRMAGSMELPTKGGFSFDLCRRNAMLEKTGHKMPGFRKTGTTIVGLVFTDGVVLGADTRATEGPIVADKNCEKIHFMAPNIYCCGAGTAADTEAVTDMVSSQLQLHRYATSHVTGPHLHTVYPHGSTDTLPFATMGSGSLAAMSVFELKYREGLTREEGIALVAEAIRAGIFNDLGSGSNVDVCVITKGNTEYLRNHELPNPRTFVSSKGYSFNKGHTEVLSTKITQLKLKPEVADGDAMEE